MSDSLAGASKGGGSIAVKSLLLWQQKFLPGDLTNLIALVMFKCLLLFSQDGHGGDLKEVPTTNILFTVKELSQ